MLDILDENIIEETMPPRSTVILKPGDKVYMCRCWKSLTFPYCDGAHKKFMNGRIGPIEVQVCTEKK